LIKTNEREAACEILLEITENKGYNNIVLQKSLKKQPDLTQQQKGFITELVNGTLRNLICIDYIINLFSKTKADKMKPFIRQILRTGIYQIYFMDRTPDSAACNEAVKLARKRGFSGLSGFVNGVLRNAARNKSELEFPDKLKEPAKYLSIKYSYPRWWIDYWLACYVESGVRTIDQIEALCRVSNSAPELGLCVNTLRTTSDELLALLSEEGMEAEPGRHFSHSILVKRSADITNSPSYQKGLFHVMDEGAMAAVEALAPKPGQVVWDPCGAPGGKSFCSAYKMNNKGRIITGDKHAHKLELIKSGASRLGIDIIEPNLWDASSNESLSKAEAETADALILDVPCSGLGLSRKKPDIKYSRTMEDIEALVKIQRQILSACQARVKPGGVLVYSTCTLSRLENEDNLEWFLNNYPYELLSVRTLWPDEYKTDGFFIAVMRHIS